MGATGWWAEILSFSVETSIQKVRAALVGNRTDPIGTATPVLQEPKASFTGTMLPVGAAAAEIHTPVFTAEQRTEGDITVAARPLTSSLTGSHQQTGTEAATLRRLTASLTGSQAQSGSMAASVAKTVASLTGTAANPDIQFISGAAAAANTVAMPTHQTGDWIMVFTFRDGSMTQPTIPAGWTADSQNTGTSLSYQVGHKVAASSSETTGTWTNATGIVVLVYRNVLGFVYGTLQTGSGSTITYPVTNGYAIATSAKSAIVRFAGHRTASNLLTNTPASHNARAGVATEARGIDKLNVSTDAAVTQSVNASSGWGTISVELYPASSVTLNATNFSDNFTGTNFDPPNSAKWDIAFGAGTIQSNALWWYHDYSSTTYIRSKEAFNLQGGELKWQVTSTVNDSGSGATTVIGATPPSSIPVLAFGGGVGCWSFTPGVATVIPVGTLTGAGSTTHTAGDWYRIRESGGTVYYDSAPNSGGVPGTWTNYGTEAFLDPHKYLLVIVATPTFLTAVTSELIIDNMNI
jgi:hypothetical protein